MDIEDITELLLVYLSAIFSWDAAKLKETSDCKRQCILRARANPSLSGMILNNQQHKTQPLAFYSA